MKQVHLSIKKVNGSTTLHLSIFREGLREGKEK
jgi:hypothetical protein